MLPKLGKLGARRGTFLLLAGRIIFAVIKPASLALSIFMFGAAKSLFLSAVISIVPVTTAAMSLPVHRTFYLEIEKDKERSLFSIYIYSILSVLILASAVIFFVACYGMLKVSGILALGVGTILLTDKIFDEIMRWTEFKKRYSFWFWLGVLRNIWGFNYIFLYWLYGLNNDAGIIAAIPALIFLSFFLSFNFRKIDSPSLEYFKRSGDNVFKTMPYYIPTLYRGLARGLDKILLNVFSPSLSSIYVTISLALNSFYILNDATIIAPNRKAIARRPSRMYAIALRNLPWRMFGTTSAGLLIATVASSFLLPENLVLLPLMAMAVLTGVVAGNLDEIGFWALTRQNYVKKIVIQLAYLGLITCWAFFLNRFFAVGVLLAIFPSLISNCLFVLSFHRGFSDKITNLSRDKRG